MAWIHWQEFCKRQPRAGYVSCVHWKLMKPLASAQKFVLEDNFGTFRICTIIWHFKQSIEEDGPLMIIEGLKLGTYIPEHVVTLSNVTSWTILLLAVYLWCWCLLQVDDTTETESNKWCLAHHAAVKFSTHKYFLIVERLKYPYFYTTFLFYI